MNVNTPVVGNFATLQRHSDRNVYLVILATAARALLQRVNVTRIDDNGMSESQTYEYSPNPDGAIITATKRKDGTWKEIGVRGRSGRVYFNRANEYYDFSF